MFVTSGLFCLNHRTLESGCRNYCCYRCYSLLISGLLLPPGLRIHNSGSQAAILGIVGIFSTSLAVQDLSYDSYCLKVFPVSLWFVLTHFVLFTCSGLRIQFQKSHVCQMDTIAQSAGIQSFSFQQLKGLTDCTPTFYRFVLESRPKLLNLIIQMLFFLC